MKSSADGASFDPDTLLAANEEAPDGLAKAVAKAPVIEAPETAKVVAAQVEPVAAPQLAPASAKPAEMLKFERAVLPLREMSPGKARGTKACKVRKSLSIGDDIPREPPHPTVDADAWRAAIDNVGSGVSEIGACCQENLGGVDPECAESMLVSTLAGLDMLQAFFEPSP